MNAYWKARLGVMAIFVLGCLAGGLAASVFFHHRATLFFQRGPAAYVDMLEHRLTHHLHLSASQKQQIHSDFMENLSQRKLLQAQIQPQMKVLNQQTMQQIRSILTPQQLAIFHKNMLELRAQQAVQAAAAASETPEPPAPMPANTNTTLSTNAVAAPAAP